MKKQDEPKELSPKKTILKCQHNFFCLGERPLPNPMKSLNSLMIGFMPTTNNSSGMNQGQGIIYPAQPLPEKPYAKFVCEYCGFVKNVIMKDEENNLGVNII
jgi:hypothetical protein